LRGSFIRAAGVVALGVALVGGASAPPDDRLLPAAEHTSDKGRELATRHSGALRELNTEVYHCLPWLEVQKHSIGFFKPRHATADERFLSIRLYIEQEPSPEFASLGTEQRASAMFSTGHRDPRALAWHPATGHMWELDRDRESGDELNTIVGGGDYGWPTMLGRSTSPRSVPPELVLPAGTDVCGASFVPVQSNSPLAGELLVASHGAKDLFRIRVAGQGRQAAVIEGMLQGRYGRLAAVSVAPDGVIYVATGNKDTWGEGADVLIRLSSSAPTDAGKPR